MHTQNQIKTNLSQSILVLMNGCYSVCTPGLTVQHWLIPTRIEAEVGGQTDQDDMHIHKSIGWEINQLAASLNGTCKTSVSLSVLEEMPPACWLVFKEWFMWAKDTGRWKPSK